MANKRIEELTQKGSLHNNDYLIIADSEDLDGNGNPVSKYILGSVLSSTTTLQESFDNGQTITIADNDNQTLAITNNDVTNDTDTITIDQNNEGYAIDIDFDCNDASDFSAMRINAANAGAGDAGALYINTGYVQIDNITAPSTTTNRLYANGGTLYWNAIDITAGGSLQASFDAGQTITIADNDNQTLTINQNDVTNNPDAVVITNSGTGNSLEINTDEFVIDSNGVVNIGGGSTTEARLGQLLETHTIGNYGGISLNSWSNTNTYSPILDFNKSRSEIPGSHSIVSNGDTVGTIYFRADDGTDFRMASMIRTQIDGTPGGADMPGRLMFYTTPDGSITPIERLRIDSAGNVGIGSNNPNTLLDIDFDCNDGSDKNAVRINAANAGAGDAGALHINTGYIQIDDITVPSTTTNRLYANSGTLYWNAIDITSPSVRSVVTKTSGYSAAVGEDVLVTCSSANITITLPAASGNSGKTILVSKRDATAYDVIVDGNGSETINSDLTHVISTQYDSFEYCCDGSNWYIR